MFFLFKTLRRTEFSSCKYASLARDYLPIMASVSSERAFSSAGITISKRRNRLKGDIVEALECIKCHPNLGTDRERARGLTMTTPTRTITLSSHDSKYATRFSWFLVNLRDRYVSMLL